MAERGGIHQNLRNILKFRDIYYAFGNQCPLRMPPISTVIGTSCKAVGNPRFDVGFKPSNGPLAQLMRPWEL